MNGLEKIIDRILSDAKEKARVIVDEANEECRRIAADYAERTQKKKDEILDEAEAEGARLITLARSEATKARRGVLSQAQSELVDRAFEKARQTLRATDRGLYTDFLVALLTSALIDVANAEEKSLSLGDEVAEYDAFEVLFGREDREIYGKTVVDNAKRMVERRIGAARAAKLVLSSESAPIDGGLILRFGDVEINCSFDMVFAEARRDMEEKVVGVLFPDQKK